MVDGLGVLTKKWLLVDVFRIIVAYLICGCCCCIVGSQHHGDSFCPVSAILHADFNHYPADIFDVSKSSKLVLYNRSAVTFCKARDSAALAPIAKGTQQPRMQPTNEERRVHTCSAHTRCPLEKHSLKTANDHGWHPASSLCVLHGAHLYPSPARASTKNRSRVNIIVLGGSVTKGSQAFGCCCSVFDNACVARTRSTYGECAFRDDATSLSTYNIAPPCTWHAHLGRWLAAIAPAADIHVVELAKGGTSSATAGDEASPFELFKALEAKNISTPLSSADLVFVDYSVNDAALLLLRTNTSAEEAEEALVNDLDRLLQRIYHGSQEGAWPSVVLLEQWPFATHKFNRTTRFTDVQQSRIDYQKAYRRVAAKYRLLLWSYRDVAWAALGDPRQRAFADTLLFQRNGRIMKLDNHPPWYVHLFHADLVAALLVQHFRACSANESSASVIELPYRTYRPVEMRLSALPPPYPGSRVPQCTVGRPVWLQLDVPLGSADAGRKEPLWRTNTSNEVRAVGTLQSLPPAEQGGWRLYEDRPGKLGWISQLPAVGDDAPPTRMLRVRSPRLFVPLSATLGDGARPSRLLLLTVVYLRSYEGMGVANVSLCGRSVGQLDGLWDSWRTVRISVTDTFRSVVDAAQHCQEAAPVVVEVSHSRAPPQVANPAYPKQLVPKRGTEKMKIVSVSLCDTALA